MSDDAKPVKGRAEFASAVQRYGELMARSCVTASDFAAEHYGGEADRTYAAVMAEYDRLSALVAELEHQYREEEVSHSNTIEQRDSAERWADTLASIAGDEVGEHSSRNNPWQNAEDILSGWSVELPQLRSRAAELEKLVAELSERVARQSEQLSKNAERQ